MPANMLVLSEREEIRAGLAAGVSVAQIARELGRHRCTIHREIARNGGRDRYRALLADRQAAQMRRRPKVPKLIADVELAAEVTQRLALKDSPMRISIELAAKGKHVSHETIYRALQQPQPLLAGRLHECLHLGRRRRKHRTTKRTRTSSLGITCSIHDRPQSAADRLRIGDIEGDLLAGAYNRSALITLFDRYSRFLWLIKTASKSAADVTAALIPALQAIPQAKTLTWDCGAEIARHPQIALATGIDIYIADPKSPWQRPTNEAGNALVRRYVGKGTNLNRFTQTDLDWIASRINTIPRRIFNWATAHHTYTAQLSQ